QPDIQSTAALGFKYGSISIQLSAGSGLLNNPIHYQLQQNSISDAKGKFDVFETHYIVGCTAGNIHSLFVSDIGVIFASDDNLGVNEDPLDQLGFVPRVVPRLLQPSPLLPALFNGKLIARVACGQFHLLTLTSDGEVGSNTHNQLTPAIFLQQILIDPYDTSYLSTAASLSLTHTHISLLVPKTILRGDFVVQYSTEHYVQPSMESSSSVVDHHLNKKRERKNGKKRKKDKNKDKNKKEEVQRREEEEEERKRKELKNKKLDLSGNAIEDADGLIIIKKNQKRKIGIIQIKVILMMNKKMIIMRKIKKF
ncbi:MAG: hypothetical protein EZS28_038462, partial [Streblomastix strix]